MNLSDNQRTTLAKHIRGASGSRHVIESYARETIQTCSHKLDSLFDVKEVNFCRKDAGNADDKRPLVYCVDVERLYRELISTREIEGDHIVKLGVDGGGNFLKVCLTIQPTNCDQKRSRVCLKDGLQFKSLKGSGVKKLLILAICPDTEENYRNVLMIWNILQMTRNGSFSGSNFYLVSDLKLANIFLGLMSHSCSHPCTWCDILRADLAKKGNLRTIGSIREKYWSFRESGCQQAMAKSYGNVTHPPILKHDDSTPIIDIIPPPELHLMMGTVNTLYNGLLKIWPEAKRWPDACHVARECLHGGTFNGNSSKKLLENVPKLRDICPPEAIVFADTFDAFSMVVDDCFGNQLSEDYQANINRFKGLYLSLNLSVTPKIHAVFYHIVDFCEGRQEGLGRWSEQSSESVHADFSKTWERYKVPHGHPLFRDRLLRAVLSYNVSHT